MKGAGIGWGNLTPLGVVFHRRAYHESLCDQPRVRCAAKLSRLFGKKSKLAEAQADLQAFEADVNQSREALRHIESKIAELNQEIEKATNELSEHTEEAVAERIQEAAKLWHVRDRSERNGSVVENAIFHAVHADVVNRVLNARLILLKDQLEAETARQAELKRHLIDLEKQS